MTAATAPTYGNLVNGAFVDTAATFEDANPADPADVVARFPASSAADVDAAVQAARAALPAWRATPPVVRGRHLRALARELRAEEATIVPAITREQGKPLRGVARRVPQDPGVPGVLRARWATSTAGGCCRRRARAWSSRSAASRSASWRC